MTHQPRAALLFILLAVLIDMMTVGVIMPVLLVALPGAADNGLAARSPSYAASVLLAVAASTAAITLRADRSRSREDP
jgi:hypothetical protein